MRYWNRRQWLTAIGVAIAAFLALGIATALIPNPVFQRMIEAPWWTYPVWVVSCILTGLLVATYVSPGDTQSESQSQPRQRKGLVGGVLSFLAVGCPTCNKIVVIALGTSGAVTWFAPVQPFLALGAVVLLAFALRSRLRSATACRVPAGAQSS